MFTTPSNPGTTLENGENEKRALEIVAHVEINWRNITQRELYKYQQQVFEKIRYRRFMYTHEEYMYIYKTFMNLITEACWTFTPLFYEVLDQCGYLSAQFFL